jgi:agmatine deiminase
MTPDWETNCVYFSRLLVGRFRPLIEQLAWTIPERDTPVRFLDGTLDIWARDYCPVQVGPRGLVQFRYEPDYLRHAYAGLITDVDTVCRQLEDLGPCRMTDMVLDGGNVVTAKSRVILTDKVYDENPNCRPGRLRTRLRELLRVEDCIIIPQEPGDSIGHADGIVRFLAEDVVATNDYTSVDPDYGRRLRHIWARHHLQVVRLPYFIENRQYDGIDSAVGNYVNFLRIGNLVLVPAYGVPQDEQACRTLEAACPELTIVPVPCVDLARQGGVLNCISWTARV